MEEELLKKIDELKCEVQVNGILASRKGCNVPGVKLTMPLFFNSRQK